MAEVVRTTKGYRHRFVCRSCLILRQPKGVDMLTRFDWNDVTRRAVIGLLVSLLPIAVGAIM